MTSSAMAAATDPTAASTRLPRIDTSLVRSVAVIAIVNSHMEQYYPWPEVAIGGLIGLALFFMAAGIGLNASRKTRTLPFLKWYWRRILRIHPVVIVAALTVPLAIFGEWRHWKMGDYVDNLIYPLSGYHFLTKILAFYVPLYFYVRWNSPYKHRWGLSIGGLVCLATAIPDIQRHSGSGQPLATGQLSASFLWSIFFFMTLLGVWMADTPKLFVWRSNRIVGIAAAAALALYLGLKYMMAKQGFFTEGFLLLYAAGILASTALIVFLSNEQLVDYFRASHPIVRLITIGLGTISLEVYLVHGQFAERQIGTSFRFPVNVIAFAIPSIVVSILVYRVAGYVRHRIDAHA